jgi:peptide/nickel transport system substrate-binding protein
MFTGAHRRPAAIALTLVVILGIIASACAAPTPQVVEKIVEKPVEKVVEKQVEKVVTQVVEKPVIQTQVVEKAVVVTATPAPTAAGSDMAADQTLRYVTRGFGRMDPASEGGFGRFIIAYLFMPLFVRDSKHNIMPWLATGYTANADMTVYTVKINPKAVWSDGSPVTAQEAKDYWTYAVDPKACIGCYFGAFTGFSIVKGVQEIIDGKATELTGVVVKDEKTLEFQLNAPDPIFPHRLALFDSGFVKMEDVKKQTVKVREDMVFNANAQTRFNGPYMIKTWDIDKKQYEIVQNPKWWGDKKPVIKRILPTESADENVSYIQWQNNEVDVAQFLSNIREKFRPTEPKTFYLMPYATNFFYYFRIQVPPMDDPNVRKALAHAVDWNKAIAAAWENSRNDRVMTSYLTPELQCYKKGNWPEWGFNPELAKKELAASKYGSADKLGKIRITPGGQSPNYIRTAEIMAEQWKVNLGITDVEIKPGTLDVWGQDADKVQVVRSSQGAIIPDPLNLISSHYNTYKNAKLTQLSVPTFEKMYDELLKMKRDDPQFCTKVQAAEAELLSQYITVPMIWDLYEYNVKSWVKNFDTNVDNSWLGLMDMYIAKH